DPASTYHSSQTAAAPSRKSSSPPSVPDNPAASATHVQPDADAHDYPLHPMQTRLHPATRATPHPRSHESPTETPSPAHPAPCSSNPPAHTSAARASGAYPRTATT